MMEIFEPKPSQNFNAAEKWITGISTSTDDMRGLWSTIIPRIDEALKYEFSNANPNGWAAISESWREHKVEMGKPATIGIWSGAMKTAFTTNAEKKKSKDKLEWLYNKGERNDITGQAVGEYAPIFHQVRPIMKYTKRFIRNILKKIAKEWAKKESSGTPFTGR